jgi:hypothetical protein
MSVVPTPGMSEDARAGWRPDPTGRFDQRFFIRGEWTRRVRFGGCEAIDSCGVDDVDDADDAGDSAGWLQVASHDAEWRPDPTGRFDQRWWDGQRFTRKVRCGQAIATDTVVALPRSRRSSRRRRDRDEHAPGWRPDPSGDGERFWNGHDWTAKWRPTGRSHRSRRRSLRGWWSRTVLVLGAGLVLLVVVVVTVVLLIALR